MNNNSEPFPQHILKHVKQDFRFMFERGYEIVSTQYNDGNYGGIWEVLLESQDFSLKIGYIEGERNFSFGTRSDALMSVEALIYLLSGQKGVLYASEAKIVNQLKRYIDEIENRFRVDRIGFVKEVESAQKKLDELIGRSSKSLSVDETESRVVFTDEIPEKKSPVVTVIRFLIFWVAYVLIMFVLSAYLPIMNPSLETIILISEVFIGFLLAAWTVRKIGNK